MITAEGIKSVNERVKKIEVKGKAYACVAARVAAFRELCPDGSITTQILKNEDGVVLMMTTIKDETGKVLATGMAQEKESGSYINKTSYIENCETSSVGRALGMLGIGSDEQMASAEEVANAVNAQIKSAQKTTGAGQRRQAENRRAEPAEEVHGAQEMPAEDPSNELIGEREQMQFEATCIDKGIDPSKWLHAWPKITKAEFAKNIKGLENPKNVEFLLNKGYGI